MSKNSAKSNYEQLMSWLETFTKSRGKEQKDQHQTKFSKADHYKSKGVRK
jgi:hypothetical protein